MASRACWWLYQMPAVRRRIQLTQSSKAKLLLNKVHEFLLNKGHESVPFLETIFVVRDA